MEIGRSGGTGKYSYRETHSHSSSVLVAHMPEDGFSIRIVFKHMNEISIPILKISENEAILLWRSLSKMAEDLKWEQDKEEEPKNGK